ncbi:MAG: dTDP-4-dehydrorhamnose 3,5-epimerase [Planctomycetes bacterium]|nr:dTDP-4-dehydrorhamnose 3,5-epimerase [Planctomycetota bacterium]
MTIIETNLPGVLVLEPRVFGDARGFFMETWSRQRYQDAGVRHDFVQDNVSSSTRGTLRGLHFQHPRGQGKLVQVYAGAVFDVAVDIRKDAPTFGQWFGTELNGEKRNQMYVPPGFAHGFCVLSDTAMFSYKCTDLYSPSTEGGIAWNDPSIGIDWPLDGEPILSDKDAAAGHLKDIALDRLPDRESYA